MSGFLGRPSKLINRYWSETNKFFKNTGKSTERISKSRLPNVCLYTNSPLTAITPTLSQSELFQRKNIFCSKPIQMQKTDNPDLLFTHRRSSLMNTWNKFPIAGDEGPSFSQSSLSSPLIFDSLKNKPFSLHWLNYIVSVL